MPRRKKRPIEIEPERHLPEDFEEEWFITAEELDRQRLLRQRPLRRVHVGFSVFDNIVFEGPTFDASKMVQRLLEQMEDVQATGYSYAIARFGRLVDAGGVGDARTPSEDDPQEMGEHTPMVSASLAKPICAVAIMKLVEDGVLTLDEAAYPHIQESFPDVDDSIEEITIYQLLTHTSGLRGAASNVSNGSLLSRFDDVLTFPAVPTTNSKYHNSNYWFLAYVVEGVTDGGYMDYATDQILSPMTITAMTNQASDVPCLYYKLGEFADGFAWGDFDTTAIGAYGWYASAIDWAKFLAYFRYDQVLNSSTRYAILNDPKTYFGFRRWWGQDRGTYYGHGGDFYASAGRGFRGGLMGFPDAVDAVLLVNNRGAFDPESILIQAYHAAYE